MTRIGAVQPIRPLRAVVIFPRVALLFMLRHIEDSQPSAGFSMTETMWECSGCFGLWTSPEKVTLLALKPCSPGNTSSISPFHLQVVLATLPAEYLFSNARLAGLNLAPRNQ